MKRRQTDTGRRTERKRRHQTNDPRPFGSEGREGDRRDPGPGRRRFDGRSVEELYAQLDALTAQTQEHAGVVGELPALLQKIEQGLAFLGIETWDGPEATRMAAEAELWPEALPEGFASREDAEAELSRYHMGHPYEVAPHANQPGRFVLKITAARAKRSWA